ncbi:uncharacterized protein LOC117600997 isoform X1 [Osmia lignaria lignaria]|uniref:uncharacterized protein LOC117600997 isoform X1 n=1 Tax=Osmia lignaria lignaria TaxID=1437193 RepID=UPI0014791F18|nr:uncharacterized protein LOC117600997 isoform X1 [Osmia lignaria]
MAESEQDFGERGDSDNLKTDKLFILKKWNAVAMWSWDVECDTCAICRVQVMGTHDDSDDNNDSGTGMSISVPVPLVSATPTSATAPMSTYSGTFQKLERGGKSEAVRVRNHGNTRARKRDRTLCKRRKTPVFGVKRKARRMTADRIALSFGENAIIRFTTAACPSG